MADKQVEQFRNLQNADCEDITIDRAFVECRRCYLVKQLKDIFL